MSRRSDCPVSCILEVVGDTWTLLLMRDILFLDKHRYDEFLNSPEGISSNVLTNRLHQMEKSGLIEKVPYGNHRYRYSYTATEKGQDLKPLLKEMSTWGFKHCENAKTLEEILVRGKNV
jgi:DNA-binding HxlR family transcriptional regulator